MKNKIKMVIIDGRGGGIGKTLVEKVKSQIPEVEIIAVGTNPAATNAMFKVGADFGATGEDAVIQYSEEADLIMGVMGILIPGGLQGELTPKMVLSISNCQANKILIPMNRCSIKVAVEENTLSQHIDFGVSMAKAEVEALKAKNRIV